MTQKHQFPQLESISNPEARNALHAYARILGDWLKSCRPVRKHWWHASLRPSLTGLTTGVVQAGEIAFELELDLSENLLRGRTSDGKQLTESLTGQSPFALATTIGDYLLACGIDLKFIPDSSERSNDAFAAHSAEYSYSMAAALNSVAAAMAEFRAGIPEETSPIQLWPHHFDLSMLWLPGEKIPGQDPINEEYSDKQMNFGFTFGDEGIPEPYFYVTAYPLPDELPQLHLPTGTAWLSEGFSGAVLTYRSLLENDDPNVYLLDLWNKLLAAGRKHMREDAS
jgi:hypothetical protein